MSDIDDFIASMSGPNATGASIAGLTPQQREPLALNAFSGAEGVLGAVQGGVSHLMFGLQAQQAARYQADQLRINAGQAQAGAQRQAFDVNQQTQFIMSRALAVAAGSGGGASDPTVVNLIARDAGQGAYEKAVALYQGTDRARLFDSEASAKDYEGKVTQLNSEEVAGAQSVLGASNLLRSQAKGASLYAKYGAGGPNPGGISNVPGVGASGWGADITGGGS